MAAMARRRMTRPVRPGVGESRRCRQVGEVEAAGAASGLLTRGNGGGVLGAGAEGEGEGDGQGQGQVGRLPSWAAHQRPVFLFFYFLFFLYDV